MLVKTVKVSDKGQIAIPREIRDKVGIAKNEELIIIQEGNKILIEKPVFRFKKIKDDFRDLLKHSELVAKRLWSSEEDDVWDSV